MTAIDVSLAAVADGWSATIGALDVRAPVAATAIDAPSALEAARALAQADVLAEALASGVVVTPAALVALELRLREACTIALAQLTPATLVVAAGLGTDVSTFPDLDRELRPISGQRAVGEAVARRWCTPLGGLVDDPEYGDLDLASMLGASVTDDELSSFAARLEAQAYQDERVSECTVTVTTSGRRDALTLTIRAQLSTSEGPFVLVLTASQLALSLDLLPS